MQPGLRLGELLPAHCADCHSPTEFRRGYATAYDLFVSRDAMPEPDPGALGAQEYADLLAYIFEASDMPAGAEELPGDPEVLKRIRIEPEKPTDR